MSNKKVKIGELEFELPFKAGDGAVYDAESNYVCEIDSFTYTFADEELIAETIADALNNHFAPNDLFHPQLETVIHFGFRYALDRTTGAVSHMSEYIVSNWHRFAPHTQKQIKDEIERKSRMSGDDWRANELPFWKKVLDLESGK